MQDRKERGRIHWDYLWYMAFQSMATYENLLAYSNTIPCDECQGHFTKALHENKLGLMGSRNQMLFLYDLYVQIQRRKESQGQTVDIKIFDEWIKFYFDRLVTNA